MFGLFNNKELTITKKRRDELEIECDDLRSERRNLKEKVEDLKLKRKIEDEDIKHMIKMKEERLDLEHKKRLQDVELEKQKAIGEVKDEYRDKTEAQLEKQLSNMKDMYSDFLARLPNISAKVKING